MSGQEPKDMIIKTNKSAHDDQSCSIMSASQDLGRIPMKNKKRKYQKLQSQGIK